MEVNNINAMLNELGWQDGFRIPVANEENKRLEEEIEKKMKLKESLAGKLEILQGRINMINKRTSNLKEEQNMNQKLLTAHTAQLETENHHYRLCCNDESTFHQETRNFEKEWKEVNEIVANIEKDLTKLTKKIEASKKAIKFDENDLQKWQNTLNQNEENNQLIEKYIKDDIKAYKELELKRQKLSKEHQSYCHAIIKVTDDTRETEIILDKTAKLYDQALKEYRQMFNQWRESVAVLQQTNTDIEKTLQEIESLQEISRDKKNTLQETEKFLKEQIEGNKLLRESIKQSEKQLFVNKEEQHKIKETISTYESELNIRKNTVKDLTQRTRQLRTDINRKEIQIQNAQDKIEELKTQMTDLTVKLEAIDNQKLNVEEKTKHLEKIIEEQGKKKTALTKEINRLQTANLRTTNQIKELENESKVLKMQYQNELKKFEYLNILHDKEEKISEQKKETLYQVEFELQKAEMKLERLRGHERDKSEIEKKEKKIEELQATLDEKTQILKLLQKQTASLEYDMRKVSNNLTNDNKELERLRNKKQELVLLVEGGEKQLKLAQAQHEEKQVEESMLRLKVSQMEKMLSNVSDNVYDLEKYQLELEAAVQERKAEITVQQESLIIEKRVVLNECSELRKAIGERKGRIQQLQARYQCSIAMLGTLPDGAPINTTYLKIQNAQERFLLQEQGDKLDETIRKTEQEIQSMENTLQIINACNEKYKLNLSVDKQTEPEKEEERKKLEKELHVTEKKMKQKEDEMQHLIEDLQKMEDQYHQMLKDIERTKAEKENKTQCLIDLEHIINDQKVKLSRANKNLKRAQKDIQNLYASTANETILLQQKEVELREVQEQNTIILQDVAEFTIRHVEVEAYIKKLLAVKNIELPSISLFTPSVTFNQSHSAGSSTECLSKNTSRVNAISSSRESIGSVVNIEPQFHADSSTVAAKDIKYNRCSTSFLKSKHLSLTRSKQQSLEKSS